MSSGSIFARKIQIGLSRLLRGGIRLRIFLLVIFVALPFVFLETWMSYQRYNIMRKHALQSELEIARGLAATFNAYLDGVRKQSLSIGTSILVNPSNRDNITEELMTATGESECMRNISWVSPQGQVLSSSYPAFVGTDLSTRQYFRRLLAGEEMVVGDVTKAGAITPQPTVVVATKIHDDQGGLQGVVVVAIEPTRLAQVALKQKRAEGGALALFDTQGNLVYHSLIDEPTWEQRVTLKESDPVLRRFLYSGVEQAGIQKIRLGQDNKWVSARVSIAGIGWVAGSDEPAGVAFAEVRQGIKTDVLGGSLALALAFSLAYFLGRSISSPVRRLQADAHIMSQGNVLASEDAFAPEEIRTLRSKLVEMTTALLDRAHELRESELSLQTVLNSIYDGILIHDLNGRAVYVNGRWLEMFRMNPDDASRLSIPDISEDMPSIEPYIPMWKEVLSGQTKFIEWRARRPVDGKVFDAEIFLCSIRYRGKDLIMANVRDITERKLVEQELQKSRAELEIRVMERTEELATAFDNLKKETEQRVEAVENLRRQEQLLIQQSRLAAMGEMILNISHQWRQPLNLIGLIVQESGFMYKQGRLNVEEVDARVKKIMEVVQHMSLTIDDFRNFLKPDKTKTRFAPHKVVEKCLSLMEKELNVSVEMSSSENCIIEGFENEYLQVILNILSNARDVFRERQTQNPRIEIKICSEGNRSVVTIADNGGGISPQVLEHIFDPFFTTKGPDKGTGVGLFMSKNIIEKNMGGKLTVQNLTDGAEFRVEV